jgi:hypothetical protein
MLRPGIMCQLQRDRFLLARNLASAEETAHRERMLPQISLGEGSGKRFIEGIKDFVTGMVKEFKESEVKVYETQALARCPAQDHTVRLLTEFNENKDDYAAP